MYTEDDDVCIIVSCGTTRGQLFCLKDTSISKCVRLHVRVSLETYDIIICLHIFLYHIYWNPSGQYRALRLSGV